jgi:prophage antirepressor-like protein
MKNTLQVFENAEFGRIRAIEIDGQTWFVGKDVCDALGYPAANPGRIRSVKSDSAPS